MQRYATRVSDMLIKDDEKCIGLRYKGRNAESYKDIAKEIDSLTQNAEEYLRVVYREYSDETICISIQANEEEAIDGLSRTANPIIIL